MVKMMAVTVYKLFAVLLLAGIRAAWSNCMDIKLNVDILEEGYKLNLTCCTRLQAKYPRWMINDRKYEVTKLPANFVARGLSLEFKLQSNLSVCCFFKTYTNGSVVDIPSDNATLVHTRNGVNVFSQCEEEKVTLVSHEQLSQIQLQILQSNSNAMVNVSRCEEENELPVTHSNGFHTVEVLKGSNITVEIDNNSENCDRTSIYVPDLKPTEVKKISTNYTGTLRNLSNNFCDFASGIIDYKICVYHEGLTECFQNPCGNGKVYTSLCGGNAVDNETVSLEVNGVENGTIVSIYCQREDCRSRPSNLLLFNIQILNCEETLCDESEEKDKGNKLEIIIISSIIAGVLVVVIAIIVVVISCCLYKKKKFKCKELWAMFRQQSRMYQLKPIKK